MANGLVASEEAMVLPEYTERMRCTPASVRTLRLLGRLGPMGNRMVRAPEVLLLRSSSAGLPDSRPVRLQQWIRKLAGGMARSAEAVVLPELGARLPRSDDHRRELDLCRNTDAHQNRNKDVDFHLDDNLHHYLDEHLHHEDDDKRHVDVDNDHKDRHHDKHMDDHNAHSHDDYANDFVDDDDDEDHDDDVHHHLPLRD
mmetsp:Transcript_12591/g.32590  ORF Transcript_12591/g.32590 Transcript_12591/m.32590 type:complete len:199 (-) Transcript_12591:2164-2760(-)